MHTPTPDHHQPPPQPPPTDPHDVIATKTTDAVLIDAHRPGGPRTPLIAACLSWSPHDPYAVSLILQVPGHTDAVTWCFARELLVHGGGIADVHVARDPLIAVLCLRSPEGHADIELPADWTIDFLATVQRTMPLGTEPSVTELSADDWARELDMLIGKRSWW